MSKSSELGKQGEKIAAEFLINKGYEILDKNFECKQGEIDIVAHFKNEVIFVEVKTRTDTKYGEAREAITPYKLKHLVNTIKYYIYKRNLQDEFIRIDVIEVYIKNKDIKINHIEKAIV